LFLSLYTANEPNPKPLFGICLKCSFIPFIGDSASSSINDTIKAEQEDIKVSSGYVDSVIKDTVFGLDKRILIFSGILIASSLGFYFYTKMKKK
jgi:hypothetical protein